MINFDTDPVLPRYDGPTPFCPVDQWLDPTAVPREDIWKRRPKRITDEQVDELLSPFTSGHAVSFRMVSTVIIQLVKWLKQERERADLEREGRIVAVARADAAEGNASHKTALLQAAKIRNLQSLCTMYALDLAKAEEELEHHVASHGARD